MNIKHKCRSVTGKDKSSTAGLSEDDEAWVQRIIKGKNIKGKLIDLRKKPPEEWINFNKKDHKKCDCFLWSIFISS